MDKIDKYIAAGNQPYSGVSTLDPRKMLNDFKSLRHILEYQLKRVISSGSAHDPLSAKPQEFSIIEKTYMYFKIPVQGQLAPAKLYIRYEDGTYVRQAEKQRHSRSRVHFNTAGKTKVDLTAYYSVTNKEPSEENNQKTIESP